MTVDDRNENKGNQMKFFQPNSKNIDGKSDASNWHAAGKDGGYTTIFWVFFIFGIMPGYFGWMITQIR